MKLKGDKYWPDRWIRIADQVNRVQTRVDLDQILHELAHPAAPRMVAFVNTHAMNTIAGSETFFDAISSADLLLRDGSGMLILFRLTSRTPGLNLNGTDLIPKIIEDYRGRKIALFGTREPYLGKAAGALREDMGEVSPLVTADGFRDPSDYITIAMKQEPALIVLGMGMPKQEEVAAQLKATLKHPCAILCGGAILDFLGGRVDRAPRWMRAIGMEWLYRLMLEPRRLFKRYVIGNPLFLLRLFRMLTFR